MLVRALANESGCAGAASRLLCSKLESIDHTDADIVTAVQELLLLCGSPDAAAALATAALSSRLDGSLDPRHRDRFLANEEASASDSNPAAMNMATGTIPFVRRHPSQPTERAAAVLGNALVGASRAGRLELVRTLLAAGADPDSVEKAKEATGSSKTTGTCALAEACRNGHTAIAEMLLDAGASVNGPTAAVPQAPFRTFPDAPSCLASVGSSKGLGFWKPPQAGIDLAGAATAISPAGAAGSCSYYATTGAANAAAAVGGRLGTSTLATPTRNAAAAMPFALPPALAAAVSAAASAEPSGSGSGGAKRRRSSDVGESYSDDDDDDRNADGSSGGGAAAAATFAGVTLSGPLGWPLVLARGGATAAQPTPKAEQEAAPCKPALIRPISAFAMHSKSAPKPGFASPPGQPQLQQPARTQLLLSPVSTLQSPPATPPRALRTTALSTPPPVRKAPQRPRLPLRPLPPFPLASLLPPLSSPSSVLPLGPPPSLLQQPGSTALPTPLLAACKAGKYAAVSLLLRRGAQVDSTHGTELLQATDARVVDGLLAAAPILGAHLGKALVAAAGGGRDGVVAALLRNGADPLASQGMALCEAAYQGHCEVLELLLSAGGARFVGSPALASARQLALRFGRIRAADMLASFLTTVAAAPTAAVPLALPTTETVGPAGIPSVEAWE